MKLYIETSVPNMLFAGDAPEKRDVTEAFFEWLSLAAHEVYTSRVTMDELTYAPEPKRSSMLEALAGIRVVTLETADREVALAEAYVREGVLPATYFADALHVATAVCHRMDVIVSWNMKHLVNLWRVRRINAVNLHLGWPTIFDPHSRRGLGIMKKIRLPEPEAVKEVHSWRQKLQKRAEKVGWTKFLAELNKRSSPLPDKPRSVVRERARKKYGSKAVKPQ